MLAHSYILAPVLQGHCMYVVHKHIQAGKTFIHIKSNKLIVYSPYLIQGLALQNHLWQFGIKNIKWQIKKITNSLVPHLLVGCVYARCIMHRSRSEDNLKSVLFFHLEGPRDQTPVFRFDTTNSFIH